MKILIFTSDQEDYLSDSLLHGFRNFLGDNAIDFPKKESMYVGYPSLESLYGRGFTLYGTLSKFPIDRMEITNKLAKGYFDLVIFSCIHSQFGYYMQFLDFLDPKRTVIIDGADSQNVFLYSGAYLRKPYFWFFPRLHRKYLYFKRELTPLSIRSCSYNLLPSPLKRPILYPISFSFPEEKIFREVPPKTKMLSSHIVDPEISERIPGSSSKHLFSSEMDYYRDLQTSRFGITTKRAGWDCMRHYEIAANGAVLCFRNLLDKPTTCAPHGLSTGNCVQYQNANDLFDQIGRMPEEEYQRLVQGGREWILENTTVKRAKYVIETVRKVAKV